MADYTKIVSFIKSKEGGLSSASTDNASRNPSNCGNGSNGKPYHTNKGVTWGTFKDLSSKLGYSATCDNFKKMPDTIWGKIYKEGYWNPMQGDRIQNQAVANTFVEMAYMSGVGSNTSSKGAIEGLTKALSAELAPKIRVNCIAPSITQTPLANTLLNTPEKVEANAQRHPLKKVGTAQDIANAAVFLLTEQSAWITGQIFHIDGGMSTVKI
jgi:NAD(P)-dependent dehydrogenase (short-subunit alcohol dehydrogenase family)